MASGIQQKQFSFTSWDLSFAKPPHTLSVPATLASLLFFKHASTVLPQGLCTTFSWLTSSLSSLCLSMTFLLRPTPSPYLKLQAINASTPNSSYLLYFFFFHSSNTLCNWITHYFMVYCLSLRVRMFIFSVHEAPIVLTKYRIHLLFILVIS